VNKTTKNSVLVSAWPICLSFQPTWRISSRNNISQTQCPATQSARKSSLRTLLTARSSNLFSRIIKKCQLRDHRLASEWFSGLQLKRRMFKATTCQWSQNQVFKVSNPSNRCCSNRRSSISRSQSLSRQRESKPRTKSEAKPVTSTAAFSNSIRKQVLRARSKTCTTHGKQANLAKKDRTSSRARSQNWPEF
jgi:hypothetical protein